VETDGALVLDNVEEKHRGKFKCVASNELGQDERSVSVTVHTAPIIDGSGVVKTVTSAVNDSVQLPCPARAYPPPERVWSYEGNRIFSDETSEAVSLA